MVARVRYALANEKMKIINALRMCSNLMSDIYTCREFKIHSIFDHAINFIAENGIHISLLSSDKPLGPNSVTLSTPNLQGLFSVGDFVFFDGQWLIFNSQIGINLQHANVTDLHIAKLSQAKLSFFAREISNFEKHSKIKSFFAQTEFNSRLLSLTNEFSSVSLRKSLSSIVGLGSGLTPSGDDFCVGVAWTLSVFSDPQAEEFIKQLALLSCKTTYISGMMFCNLQKGLFVEPLVQFSHCQDSVAAQVALKHLSQIGHTSGMDTIFGIKWALNYLKIRELIDVSQ